MPKDEDLGKEIENDLEDGNSDELEEDEIKVIKKNFIPEFSNKRRKFRKVPEKELEGENKLDLEAFLREQEFLKNLSVEERKQKPEEEKPHALESAVSEFQHFSINNEEGGKIKQSNNLAEYKVGEDTGSNQNVKYGAQKEMYSAEHAAVLAKNGLRGSTNMNDMKSAFSKRVHSGIRESSSYPGVHLDSVEKYEVVSMASKEDFEKPDRNSLIKKEIKYKPLEY